MNTQFKLLLLFVGIVTLIGCESGVRDVTGGVGSNPNPDPDPNPNPVVEVVPVDITQDGFDFLEKMQGHWVGTNKVINDEFPWFAWDYRAISKSHIHGIHEGGTLGNLLTSFFVTNFKGKRTIMARNGGLLNGIYRTSYFVMDSVKQNGANDKYYRLVDARGGTGIMHMELRFKNDSLYFNSYTSNLGNRVPSRHMTFKGKRMHFELAQAAKDATGFPVNEIDAGLDFANGFVEDNLYKQQGQEKAKSTTFLAQQNSNDVYELAPQSGDPYIITDHPRLGSLVVNLTRGSNSNIADDNLLVWLSKEPLTDASGFLSSDASVFDTMLHFPTLENKEDFTLFTYLHPGEYYVNVIADKDKDGSPGAGDITSISQKITIGVKEDKVINVTNINVQN
ncbi:hypothetical protein WH52_11250 [Tenacibaculum holothuriorum]|uniref:Uncharacterized protein n=1 Tax=Tenacibaculum holothuriorum TaxID=1635173 RepID=A0A1Y2PAG0_9FLAO|nr:hypothetical protein [Tenacibaculum holothuriorum]OSY87444.1 hypothetical protein WH52_11250 [Tenacibaculum holothuriorum]